MVRTKVAYEPQARVSLMFLPHLFDVICDLLLNICTATRDLFVKLAMELVVFDLFKKKKTEKDDGNQSNKMSITKQQQ